MGSSGANLSIEQIKSYYNIQKRFQSVLNKEQNGYIFNQNKSKFEIEKAYLINHNWIKTWKQYTNYEIAKDSFDKITFTDEKFFEQQMNNICNNLMEDSVIQANEKLLFENNKEAYKRITNKQILKNDYFECIVDKKTFKLFQDIGQVWYLPNEKEYKIDIIISKKMIILLIKKKYLVKFLYYGDMECDNQLIQLSAKCFDKAGDGKNSEKIYDAFVNYILSVDEDYLINSFNNNNAGFMKNLFMTLKEGYKIEFQNEHLAQKYFEQEKKKKNLDFNNINNFRMIGLANIGATCYMNATLECFINVDPLTRYLLNQSNYYQIINDSTNYELSSAYCDVLASVCLDNNVNKYFEPYTFKDVISWKNPLFEGVNANDSKDLINFMLEEMNQELYKLSSVNKNNNSLNKVKFNQIDQTNQQLTLNTFRKDFTQKNDSIISRTFFFIIESKSQCQQCQTITYNYQSLFILEFPLEAVFNFFAKRNCYLINNNGQKVINLFHCLEQFKEPTYFTGENTFYCKRCNRQTDSMNSNVLYSLPPYLIIILNRGKGKSFDCVVDFPEFLDLQNYVMCPQSIHKYQLNGVICHLGSSGMSGHFIAYCRQRIKNKWYCFNDANITLCKDQNNDYKKGSPYILFYEAIDKRPNVLFSNDIPFYNNNSNNNN